MSAESQHGADATWLRPAVSWDTHCCLTQDERQLWMAAAVRFFFSASNAAETCPRRSRGSRLMSPWELQRLLLANKSSSSTVRLLSLIL